MTKTKKQREYEAYEAHRDRMNAALKPIAGKIICRKCGATTETFNDVCDAPLDTMCDGFVVIEMAHYPDERNLVNCHEEQLRAEITSLRSQLEEARAKAIEECATLVDVTAGYWRNDCAEGRSAICVTSVCEGISESIRALLSAPTEARPASEAHKEGRE